MFRQIDYSRYGKLGLSKLMQELIRRRQPRPPSGPCPNHSSSYPRK